MTMRVVFATSVTTYAITAAVGMNFHEIPFDQPSNNLLAESIKNAVIRKLTPAHELAIRKL